MSSVSDITQSLWAARIPLCITHASSPSTPLFTSVPRFSYLALLLPRLNTFFALHCSSFHYEDVQLRNLSVGLLVDLYAPSMPFRLTVSDGVAWDMADTFLNSAKEADYMRNGNSKQVMNLTMEHTRQFWQAVMDNDVVSFTQVQTRLLNAPTALKHVPVRVYIPDGQGEQFRVVQKPVPAKGTLGQGLRTFMPQLFPSSRDPVLANVVMHGAPVPFAAPLVDLMREAAYPDGWLCLVVRV